MSNTQRELRHSLVTVNVKHSIKKKLQAVCDNKESSLSAYVNRLIEKDLKNK